MGEHSASGAPWFRQGQADPASAREWDEIDCYAAPCLHLPALTVQGGAGTSGLACWPRQDSLAAVMLFSRYWHDESQTRTEQLILPFPIQKG